MKWFLCILAASLLLGGGWVWFATSRSHLPELLNELERKKRERAPLDAPPPSPDKPGQAAKTKGVAEPAAAVIPHATSEITIGVSDKWGRKIDVLIASDLVLSDQQRATIDRIVRGQPLDSHYHRDEQAAGLKAAMVGTVVQFDEDILVAIDWKL